MNLIIIRLRNRGFNEEDAFVILVPNAKLSNQWDRVDLNMIGEIFYPFFECVIVIVLI